ncbi:hypothetical protein [Marinifilum fragile]|uniref:hypothetical protein n=1 Tax=Marinifilum fragile TaxID=570161 RepID=UPI002AA8DE6B|nr:hypothetical protein [Marinifilum fragile]
MKMKILMYSLIAMILMSCSKDESQPKNDEYNISCNLSVFSQTIEDINHSIPMKSSTKTSLADHINSYHYKIWKLTGSDDELLKESKVVIIGESDNAENIINTVLTAGNYHIMVVGNSYKEEIEWNNSSSSDYLFECKELNQGSVFVISKSFEVKDTELKLDLKFKRLSSKLRIKFLNELPENITNIEVYSQKFIDNIGGYYYESKFGFRTRGNEYSILVERNNDNIYDLDLLPYTKDWFAELTVDGVSDYVDLSHEQSQFYTIHITLKYKDINGNIVSEQDIEDVLLLPNQRTILSGNYVGVGETGNMFDLTLDDSWGEDLNQSF